MPDTPSNSSPMPLLYGVPFSQPVRAVMWLLLYKRLPFRMVPTIPGLKGEAGSRGPQYLSRNPGGTIPTYEELDTGLVIGESHAIMCYLANRHGWNDLYPDDPARRARVDWYLHYHHRNLREVSVGLVAPKIRKDLEIPEIICKAAIGTFTRALRALETSWLAESPFIAADSLSLADFAAYSEIGQLQSEFTALFDFEPYPNIRAWLTRMKKVDSHDDAQLVLAVLGDISTEAPSIERIKEANVQGFTRVRQRVAQLAAA